MKKYIEDARKKAGDMEKYAIENGSIYRRYVDGKLMLVFKVPYSTVYKSVVYFNCVTSKFCNINGK